MSKGSTPRPLSVSADEYGEKHERIFGKIGQGVSRTFPLGNVSLRLDMPPHEIHIVNRNGEGVGYNEETGEFFDVAPARLRLV